MNNYIDKFSKENLINLAEEMDALDYRDMLDECRIEYKEIYIHDDFDPNDGVFHIVVEPNLSGLEVQYVKGELQYAGNWITK
jgi:hypothetical protein